MTMRIRFGSSLAALAIALIGPVGWGVGQGRPAAAQTLAPCPPPAADEYVLLVNASTPEDRSRLNQVLPAGATVLNCQVQERPVIRVGNFADEALATSWAEYLSTIEGFQTVVAQTPSSPVPAPATPVVTPTSPSNPTYDPTVLEPGYAVLVRYFDRPDVASTLQTALNAPVGLAVYEQQPYLLAAYSADVSTAGLILRELSDQFSTVMVDSQQVVLLSPTIALPVERRQ